MQAVASLIGRLMITTVFLMSDGGNKIPKFSDFTGYMASEGVPLPQVMLAGGFFRLGRFRGPARFA